MHVTDWAWGLGECWRVGIVLLRSGPSVAVKINNSYEEVHMHMGESRESDDGGGGQFWDFGKAY